MDLIANLNQPQVEAVTSGDGPLLVLAGAGSGKTRVLTSRVAYLLKEKRVQPHRILAITFTNKAAQEMRERINSIVPDAARDLWICTFHAACVRILRRQEEFFGRNRNFVIYDADDQLTLIKDCLKELNLDDKKYPPRSVAWSVSQAKNQLVDAVDFERQAINPFSKKVSEVYYLYSEKLRRNNAVDFDDLIFFTVRLFQSYPQVLSYYQDRFRYILVDEYQDTNHAQYVLVNLLAGVHRNLFVVGDPDQGIYGWRGADIKNIMSFERDYPDAHVVTLEQNYRSTSSILEAANEIIRNNPGRKEKSLWTAAGTGAPLVACCGTDERDEADYVAGQILFLKDREEKYYKDFAVLFRTHAQSRVIEEIFVRAGLPYTIIGGLKFYDRKEIKDIMAYLRVILNHFDSVGLARIINVPKRGIGQASFSKITAFASELNISPVEALERAAEIPGLSGKVRHKGKELGELIRYLSEQLNQISVTELTRVVMEQTGYRQELLEENTVDSRTRLENLDELLSATGEFDQEADENTLQGFLENVALVTDTDKYDQSTDQVTLMTLHSAKGLEFPVVFITGMEEGIFPHSRALTEPGELEEERRLCYVGITRAMERLYLTRCWKRNIYGAMKYNPPSRFLEEIPPHLLNGDNRINGDDFTNENEWQQKTTRSSFAGAPAHFKPKVSRTLNTAGQLEMGDKVKHKKWGIGTIVGIQGEGEDIVFQVAFPGEGIKDLMARYAPLEKAN
ncbi:DNA helicase PcrA [Pelotomaculum isophthalicicum JI]|uniref:ATP-dependent DNA helicase n=1 Tax=Pelotomaculum isophthalicicum JI TaxID=947010 RepID=A0A9X4JTC4_9FIRM|nr:DNA helicase PcrA [Pelotomaculum isophthalicicum]MDF9407240.1 DNA helicase PcrA [Pelotomaculum isophthalicicum JI]